MQQGVYCLVVALDKTHTLEFGNRKQRFPHGFYCYINTSADIKQSLTNHLSETGKKTRIDELIKKGRVINHKTIRTKKKIESAVNKKIQELSNQPIPFPGNTHLYYFKECPLFLEQFHAFFEELRD
jgi:Uri superfamily endonuclease